MNGHAMADVEVAAIPPPTPIAASDGICFELRDIVGVYPRELFEPFGPGSDVWADCESDPPKRINARSQFWDPLVPTPLRLTNTGTGWECKKPGRPWEPVPLLVYGGPNCFVKILNEEFLMMLSVRVMSKEENKQTVPALDTPQSVVFW
eukprot:TRINITY_DN68048_c0_g1_i2.p2 TRINITY_DN68048_c0_g1~~TRINITY_DN68048_c0_g1_i2.p2  ORF type:complete len:149 (+),score=17.72 TRINITY_DN68048_c0_g1_i2:732-1178(+)